MKIFICAWDQRYVRPKTEFHDSSFFVDENGFPDDAAVRIDMLEVFASYTDHAGLTIIRLQ